MRRVVELLADERAFAIEVGVARERWNRDRGHRGLYLTGSKLPHALGAQGELALAKYLGVEWITVSENPFDLPGDVGAYEVRTCWSKRPRSLALGQKDFASKADRVFISVTARPPSFFLDGWYRPSDGVEPAWWRTATGCFVPVGRLHDMDDLPALTSC